MGHAHVANIHCFVTKRLYTRGASIAELAVGLTKAGEQLHTSEAYCEDDCMLRMGVTEIIKWLHISHQNNPGLQVEPYAMDRAQQTALWEWLDGDTSHWDPGNYGVFESIRWRYAKGWRWMYKSIPVLTRVTN